MFSRMICVFVMAFIWPITAVSQDRQFTLFAPVELIETGFLKHLLPRFSLKTSVRIQVVDTSETADVVLTSDGDGLPVFSDTGQTWQLILRNPENPHIGQFSDWITAEVGLRTIEAFTPNGKQMFSRPIAVEKAVQETVFEGNAKIGETISMRRCGRCHVVSDANKMNAIGSSPSFAVLRSFTDWENRFSAFFALNPHPAFTQIEGVTEPFDPTRPSPISPLLLTLDELEAILAFVAQIKPADLGAPIQSQ